jgi:hypothetical protein
MPKRLQSAAVIALAVCILVGFGEEIWRASNIPHSSIERSTATKDKVSTSEEKSESTEEAIARYNKWLTIFTSILAFATVGLGLATVGLYFAGKRQLALAEQTASRHGVEIQDQIDIAKISARAADESAKAAIAAERARFFIVIKKHNLDDILKSVGRYPNSPTMPLSPYEPSIEYVFKNYGKTPGIISEVSHGLAVHPGPPDPVYTVSGHLFVENMIAAGEETELQKFDGPVLFHTVADGLPILTGQKHFWFYGRFDYEDVFGNPQVHRFLMRYVKTGLRWGFQPYDYKHYNKST